MYRKACRSGRYAHTTKACGQVTMRALSIAHPCYSACIWLQWAPNANAAPAINPAAPALRTATRKGRGRAIGTRCDAHKRRLRAATPRPGPSDHRKYRDATMQRIRQRSRRLHTSITAVYCVQAWAGAGRPAPRPSNLWASRNHSATERLQAHQAGFGRTHAVATPRAAGARHRVKIVGSGGFTTTSRFDSGNPANGCRCVCWEHVSRLNQKECRPVRSGQ